MTAPKPLTAAEWRLVMEALSFYDTDATEELRRGKVVEHLKFSTAAEEEANRHV